LKNKTLIRAIIILVIFYLVGLAGFIIPATYKIFSGLTPFALLLSTLFLILFHKPRPDGKTIIAFIIIMALSFFIEGAGVKTGVIFGNYYYSKGLGPKLMDTPLLIGLNWIMLVYCTKVITDRLPGDIKIKIFIASVLMVLYDLIMEQTAGNLEMWYWENGIIPLRNYIAWFLIALLFHTLLKKMKISFSNKMALPVFAVQLLFFLILYAYFSIFA
jgi:bisanhydrobacterioruberin hydratase